jgi:hypothetical protein
VKCRFRIVLEGQETECVVKGEHDVHTYYAPKTGKKYEVELVDLEGKQWMADREAARLIRG